MFLHFGNCDVAPWCFSTSLGAEYTSHQELSVPRSQISFVKYNESLWSFKLTICDPKVDTSHYSPPSLIPYILKVKLLNATVHIRVWTEALLETNSLFCCFRCVECMVIIIDLISTQSKRLIRVIHRIEMGWMKRMKKWVSIERFGKWICKADLDWIVSDHFRPSSRQHSWLCLHQTWWSVVGPL